VLRGLGCAWGETSTVAMTCASTLGAIPGSSFGAMSTIVNEPGSAFGDPSLFGVRAASIRTGPHPSTASQDLSHDAYSRRNAG